MAQSIICINIATNSRLDQCIHSDPIILRVAVDGHPQTSSTDRQGCKVPNQAYSIIYVMQLVLLVSNEYQICSEDFDALALNNAPKPAIYPEDSIDLFSLIKEEETPHLILLLQARHREAKEDLLF